MGKLVAHILRFYYELWYTTKYTILSSIPSVYVFM